MYKEDLKILNEIQILGASLSDEIKLVKERNQQIVSFLESGDIDHQSLLLNSPWGSGKTYTLKLLELDNFDNIKKNVQDNISDDDGNISLDDVKLDAFKDTKNLGELIKLLNNSTKITKWNLNRLLNTENRFVFINIDEILHNENWINELFWFITTNLMKNKIYSSESDFNEKTEKYFNDIGIDLKSIKNEFRKNQKLDFKPIIESFIEGKIITSIYNISKIIKTNDNKKSIDDIYKLLSIQPKTTFVFENLERVSDDKVVNFFGSFNAIFNKIYYDKDNNFVNHKFIFNVDEEVLQNKFNYDDKFKNKFLSKFFDLQISLISANEIKISKFEQIILKLHKGNDNCEYFPWIHIYNNNAVLRDNINNHIKNNYSIRELDKILNSINLNSSVFSEKYFVTKIEKSSIGMAEVTINHIRLNKNLKLLKSNDLITKLDFIISLNEMMFNIVKLLKKYFKKDCSMSIIDSIKEINIDELDQYRSGFDITINNYYDITKGLIQVLKNSNLTQENWDKINISKSNSENIIGFELFDYM